MNATINAHGDAMHKAQKVMERRDAAKPAPKVGDLRIWWIAQIPGSPFRAAVASVNEAKRTLDTLAMYDMFQLANNIKPDYCNAGGLEVFDGGEWTEWEDARGCNIDDFEEVES